MISVFPLAAAAQLPHPAYRQFTTRDGLPSLDVYQVFQDSKGYIWLATGNGISRYNGYEFENFSERNGLPDHTFFEIREDRTGRIWFVPISFRLSWYDYADGKIHLYPYNDVIRKNTRYRFKSSFDMDDSGAIYFGLYDENVFKVSADGKFSVCFPGLKPNENGIFEPQPGKLVFANMYSKASTDTILLSDGKNTVYMEFKPYQSTDKRITRAIRRKDGRLVVSRSEQLYVYDSPQFVRIYNYPSKVTWLYEDKNGNFWIGTYLHGVFFSEGGDLEKRRNFLPGKSVVGLLQDNEGGYWITTEGDGVFYVPSLSISTYTTETGLGDDKIKCIETDGKNIFAGTKSGYLHTIAPDGKVVLEKIRSNPVVIDAMYYDAGTNSLLYGGPLMSEKKQLDTGKRISSGNGFYNVAIGPDGKHWACYSTGIYPLDFITLNYKPYHKSGHRVYSMLVYDRDHFLAGTFYGLLKFNIHTMTYAPVGQEYPVFRTRISDMHYAGDSLLVIGTRGSGLVITDKKRILRISVEEGLSDAHINKLFIDSNRILAGTNNGLSVVTIRSWERQEYSVVRIGTENGLPSREVNDLLKLGNRIWMATSNGLAYLDESTIIPDPRSTPVIISGISIGESDTVIKNGYVLPYDKNNLRISFLAFRYRNYGTQSYRFRMEGLDTAWVITRNRDVQFTTLPPGKYRFTVNALDVNGKWSARTTSVEFIIRAPFWRSWWFVIAVALSGAFIFSFIYQLGMLGIRRRREKRENLKRTLVGLKLKALRAQMDPHFTFNVMNSIQHFMLNRQDESANKYLSKFASLMRAILNNSETETVSLYEEIKALELYMELEAMRFENSFEYRISVAPDIDTSAIGIPSMLIQPYVENAILHGVLPLKRKGIITITIRRDQHLIKCTIEDNGVGRSVAGSEGKARVYPSMGTRITKERLAAINDLYGGELSENITDLFDEEGKPCGTRVDIYFPVNSKG